MARCSPLFRPGRTMHHSQAKEAKTAVQPVGRQPTNLPKQRYISYFYSNFLLQLVKFNYFYRFTAPDRPLSRQNRGRLGLHSGSWLFAQRFFTSSSTRFSRIATLRPRAASLFLPMNVTKGNLEHHCRDTTPTGQAASPNRWKGTGALMPGPAAPMEPSRLNTWLHTQIRRCQPVAFACLVALLCQSSPAEAQPSVHCRHALRSLHMSLHAGT